MKGKRTVFWMVAMLMAGLLFSGCAAKEHSTMMDDTMSQSMHGDEMNTMHQETMKKPMEKGMEGTMEDNMSTPMEPMEKGDMEGGMEGSM